MVIKPSTVRVAIQINPKLHEAMRELAKRKRVHTGVVYESAIASFLSNDENYMGQIRTVRKPVNPNPVDSNSIGE